MTFGLIEVHEALNENKAPMVSLKDFLPSLNVTYFQIENNGQFIQLANHFPDKYKRTILHILGFRGYILCCTQPKVFSREGWSRQAGRNFGLGTSLVFVPSSAFKIFRRVLIVLEPKTHLKSCLNPDEYQYQQIY